jgi:hypothetical protein
VSLICRPRRFGKSLNMDTLRRFLTDAEDNRGLFAGLAVEKSPVWDQANSAPVFYFDFKGLLLSDYRYRIYAQVLSHIFSYCERLKDGATKRIVQAYLDNRDAEAEGLSLLTRAVYEVTGKMSYILVDEYDSLLIQATGTDKYAEIRDYLAALFSSVFKGNPHLAKGLLTGVMRVSYEGMFSGLNNVEVFDAFSDRIYMRDFGFVEQDMAEISTLRRIDRAGAKEWYNGFSVAGERLYNPYSVCCYLKQGRFRTYWGMSGTMDIVANAMNARRLAALESVLVSDKARVPMEPMASLAQLEDDAVFYSVLVQAGYLSLADADMDSDAAEAEVCAPNQEALRVWKRFIFRRVVPQASKPVSELFALADPKLFARGLEALLADSLSYWDVVKLEPELPYHMFVLGGLVFSDLSLDKSKIKSNREAGDGRYDIWMEKDGVNYIFEFKACKDVSELERRAGEALRQIDAKRYGAEFGNAMPQRRVGISCFKKQCHVACEDSLEHPVC